MRKPNHVLAGHLYAAGWRPSDLAAAINELVGPGYTTRSTVSEWLHAGRIPREPLPAITASLLSEATGSQVAVSDLWPGMPLAPTWTVPADDGLDRIVRQLCPVLAVARDWITHCDRRAGCDRRSFSPVPRYALPSVGRESARLRLTTAEGTLGAITQVVASQFAQLPGTPAALRFIHRQVITLAETLTDIPTDWDISAALSLAVCAAGELAHSLGKPGLSQRYRATGEIIRSELNAAPD